MMEAGDSTIVARFTTRVTGDDDALECPSVASSFITSLFISRQVSYSLLARVSPVTHSVANSLKRVVVIVTSVLFFRTLISRINALGTGVALAGVFLYSQFKKSKPKATAA
ncbi:Phosphoenolpyruvate/phosphate translocator 1, chloroplastic [Zea mays]|uniref:Sugar phosphate transporter domain-containing protein n=2 Tax=Zea mays TaxID=4577 RepID=A0A3L6F5M6_MAIZE|nr:hypothetical protein Zm00014a_042485 [Zea mays]PWZ28477.1 Phosphoenolpyruvate/phosphate translocator 1, chloroplastic [Zea mays]